MFHIQAVYSRDDELVPGVPLKERAVVVTDQLPGLRHALLTMQDDADLKTTNRPTYTNTDKHFLQPNNLTSLLTCDLQVGQGMSQMISKNISNKIPHHT